MPSSSRARSVRRKTPMTASGMADEVGTRNRPRESMTQPDAGCRPAAQQRSQGHQPLRPGRRRSAAHRPTSPPPDQQAGAAAGEGPPPGQLQPRRRPASGTARLTLPRVAPASAPDPSPACQRTKAADADDSEPTVGASDRGGGHGTCDRRLRGLARPHLGLATAPGACSSRRRRRRQITLYHC